MFGRSTSKRSDIEIFTIFDSKAEAYLDPSFAMNQHDLVREIINMFRNPSQAQNKLLINAEDFSVFKIGSFDRSTGKLSACNLEHVCNLHDLRAVAQKGVSAQQQMAELREAFASQAELESRN